MSTFPQPFTSTVSHWQATNRGPDSFFGHNKDKALPSEVIDYVVVGAGMAGASTAYHLTREVITPGKTTVVLEAKDVASGATGRNGGHCAPYSFSALPELTKPLSEGGGGLSIDDALDVLDLERRVLLWVEETVHREGWEIDLWKGEKVEVRLTQTQAQRMDVLYKKWAEARNKSEKYKDIPLEWSWTWDEKKAQADTRFKGAVAYSKGPAGSIHPHKLASAFLRSALKSGQAELYSWAPVQGIQKVDGAATVEKQSENGLWEVNLGKRGKLRARNVVICTNAYTPGLLKGTDIERFLTPFQGQAANVTPPPTYSGSSSLAYTYTSENGTYLISTPHAGIVLGLTSDNAIKQGVMDKKEIYGNWNDSYVQPAAEKWLGEFCKKNFEGWGEEAVGEGRIRAWTGIQCATQDTLPLIGSVPLQQLQDEKKGNEGLYVAAGFQGHGMARIVLSTKYLAEYITTGQWNDGLPSSFIITQERLERGNKAPPYITPGEKIGGVRGWVVGVVDGVKSVQR
ncbi:hypothetical protein L202_00048 [Cryptococcus amylolentus CBS 6039]|uniref:FAD dependent oxidoreductase domain-containing protein n=1 Tax=Cryptococcus amylolentus CBS 6039 TaxID=1295533 RepID=A0A1E3I5P3_9TREE|nr:hypothetical protein L202_00048 [Cryptococcus amylolentus CBS 6039]ODN84013.1 hypothetical protein L202_00048 [Cryptococcus amylolentus CBS 6039]